MIKDFYDEILICFVNMNQFKGDFDNLSDEEVLKLADENHRVYTLRGFEECFNDSPSFLVDACTQFVRIIDMGGE